jgi:ubiquinone/menaquinone biosynthesis C-methylase UbiE
MRRQLAERVPEAEILAGTAESIPLGDASVDAVLVAEAFHWFSTREAVEEIARVVRPGGGLALLWNAHDFGGDPWVGAMGELINSRRAPGVTPINRKHTGLWKTAFEGSPFEPLQLFQTRHEQRTDVDGLVAHIATWSFVGALEDEPRAALARDLGDLLRREHPSPHDVAIPYRTDVYWTRRP